MIIGVLNKYHSSTSDSGLRCIARAAMIWVSAIVIGIALPMNTAGAGISLEHGQERVDPTPELRWLLDETQRLTLDEVSHQSELFAPMPANGFLPRSTGTYWLRLSFDPMSADTDEWLLELAYTQLDEVRFYARNENRDWNEIVTGDTKVFSSRERRHPNFVFRLPFRAGEPLEVFLRIQTSTSVVAPITLWQAEAFQRKNLTTQFASGIYYGLLLALAAYNLFLYPVVRDSSYLFYVAYLVSIGLFQFSHEGLAFMYLWPESPQLADKAVTLTLSLSYISGLQFARRMVRTNHFAPRVDRVMRIWAWLSVTPALLVLWVGPGPFFLLLPLLAFGVIVLVTLALVYAWSEGYRPARWVLLAYSALLPGGVLLVLRTLDLIGASFWTEHLLQIGTGVEAVLLSFALADRINLLRSDKESVQGKLLAVEKSARQAQQLFSRQLIDTQDHERARLAKDLHDGLGQHLSLLKNGLWRLVGSKGVTIPPGLMDAAGDAIKEVRDVTQRLHPHLLDRLGLRAALESVAERMLGTAQIEYTLELDEIAGFLSPSEELHLYRIVQESLSNILRHSGARHVEISLRCGEYLSLLISDDGRGLPDTEAARGFGLVSIAERAKALEGEARFENRPDGGYRVVVEIPIRNCASPGGVSLSSQ